MTNNNTYQISASRNRRGVVRDLVTGLLLAVGVFSPSLWGRVNRLRILALGLAMFAGSGCQTDVARATFCHSITIDGQPTVLQLVQEERTFTTRTGECSPCGPLRINDTFDLEVRDPSGNVLVNRFIYLRPNILTYLISAHSNPDGTYQLGIQPHGSNVSCTSIRVVPDGGTSNLLSEGGEEASFIVPAELNETPRD